MILKNTFWWSPNVVPTGAKDNFLPTRSGFAHDNNGKFIPQLETIVGKKSWKMIEVVSKPQIRFKGKAQADEKAQHTRQYVSILRRLATLPLSLRWGFETTSSYLRR